MDVFAQRFLLAVPELASLERGIREPDMGKDLVSSAQCLKYSSFK